MATSDVNCVVLIGRLTRDAELSYTQGGMAVASLSVAVNRSRKDGDQWISEVNYFDVSYFGKGAEAVKQYLTKGKQLAIQGSLQQSRWEKDGQKFSKVRVIANSVELLGGGRADGGGGMGGYQQRSGYTARSSSDSQMGDAMPPEQDSFGGGGDGFPEDIPF